MESEAMSKKNFDTPDHVHYFVNAIHRLREGIAVQILRDEKKVRLEFDSIERLVMENVRGDSSLIIDLKWEGIEAMIKGMSTIAEYDFLASFLIEHLFMKPNLEYLFTFFEAFSPDGVEECFDNWLYSAWYRYLSAKGRINPIEDLFNHDEIYGLDEKSIEENLSNFIDRGDLPFLNHMHFGEDVPVDNPLELMIREESGAIRVMTHEDLE
jgi:hypothetical protein